MLKDGPGFQILLAPESPEYAELITDTAIRSALDELRKQAAHIVVDTAATIDAPTLALIEMANVVIHVAGRNPAARKNALSLEKLLNSMFVSAKERIFLFNHERCEGEGPGSPFWNIGGQAMTLPYDEQVAARSARDNSFADPAGISNEFERSIADLAEMVARLSKESA